MAYTINADYSVNDWLSYIESIHPKNIDLSLDRIKRVAAFLGVEKLKGKVIIVTGTNGKGSVTTLLSKFLNKKNLKTNLFNSPHLIKFNERITILGHEVDDQTLIDAFQHVEYARLETQTSLTFFEFTTLAAFYCFNQTEADYNILEVGMGGRYDATNIVPNDLAIITNVALDHTAFLGSNREEIAYQKVGILHKQGKLIYAESDLPQSIMDYTKEQEGTLWHNSEQYSCSLNLDHKSFNYQGLNHTLNNLPIPTIPIDNVAAVLCALEILGFSLEDPKFELRAVIENFAMPGRMQHLMHIPTDVYVDVGHNDHAFNYIKKKLALINQNQERRIVAVIGMLKDKDFHHALNTLAPTIDQFYFANTEGVRGLEAKFLKEALKDPQKKEQAQCFERAIDAFKCAFQESNREDLILVCGSFLIAGAIIDWHNHMFGE